VLLRPLLSVIARGRITVVPHGVLHGLPFHAFYDSETEQYSLDRWEIAYSPSATVRYLEFYHKKNPKDSSVASGALVMGVPHPGLGQIEVEVAELGALLPNAEVLVGPAATLDKFFATAVNSKMIHLATHALFRADNPLFSGLKFADGWLLARDLYSMRLKCDLVTLSACRTGLALVESGDEMFGLLRGFLAAGARAVAVSLWPAEDKSTASLMTRFHALMAQGQSRTAALRLAQQYIRQTWQHPYQWAAFAIFGGY
jgi:CHAT domain-containing protein